MSMQLMRAMHQSVSQVLDQPHFGFEWVEPDYRFDGFGDAEDLGEVLNEFTNCQASSSRQHDTSGHTSARNQSSEAENKKGKTEKLEKNVQIPIQPTTSFQPDLTSNAMEELYYELERYSELYNQ